MGPPRLNEPSLLLTQEENGMVFSFLGNRCQSMSTAVVQLFTTSPPTHTVWRKRLTGIACFVRDSAQRSYFVRIFCLARQELYWDEQMHRSTVVEKPREFLVSFEGKDCMIGLSFASEAEANAFHTTMVETITCRASKRQQRLSLINEITGHGNKQISEQQPTHSFKLKKNSSFRNKNDGKSGRRKITKLDISLPTNFKHIKHSGWDGLRQLDIDAQNEENGPKNAQPIEQMRPAPQKPRGSPRNSPRSAPRVAKNRNGPLRAAPAVSSIQNLPLPPPPPPPQMNGAPNPPPPPPMLPPMTDSMDSIASNERSRTGPTSNAPAAVQSNTHSELMEQIRKRNILRKVDPAEIDEKKTIVKPVNDLQKALENRMNKVNLSDSDDEEYSSDSDSWEDD